MLKGSTVKEVNVCWRQNKFTVVAWSMFSQRKTECHPTVIPFHGISTYDLVCWGKQTEVSYGNTIPRNLVVWYVEETFRIDELLCCFDVKVLVCKAMKMFKSWWPKNDEQTTKDERRTNELIGPNFRDLIGTNSDRLVRIPNDWSEFSRFDWYEFRSIGTNSERLVRISNEWRMTSSMLRPTWTRLT